MAGTIYENKALGSSTIAECSCAVKSTPSLGEVGGVDVAEISLDQLVSGMTWATEKYTPSLKENRTTIKLLRLLICRLYGRNPYKVSRAEIMASQADLGAHLGVSREWVNKSLSRLQDAGWISYRATRISPKRFTPCVFKPGPQFKRLLMTLIKSRSKKTKKHYRVNDRLQVLPLSQKERENSYILFQKLKAVVANVVQNSP